MKAQSETEFNLQIAPKVCLENTLIDKRKDEDKSLVVKKFGYVKEPLNILWDPLKLSIGNCPIHVDA